MTKFPIDHCFRDFYFETIICYINQNISTLTLKEKLGLYRILYLVKSTMTNLISGQDHLYLASFTVGVMNLSNSGKYFIRLLIRCALSMLYNSFKIKVSKAVINWKFGQTELI
jgi:hypothetical protein